MSDVIAPGKKSKRTRSKKLDNLIGNFDKKIDAQARDRLITARVGLLFRHAFWGNLASRLKLVNADDWCATAATDGYTLYYNSRFVMMLKVKEVEFLVAHEVMHVVYDHMDRRGTRDPQLWNIAGDYAVNADLKRHKIGEFITTVPCLYDVAYDGKPAEEIYDVLFGNADKIDVDSLIDKLLDDHIDDDDGDSANDSGDKDSKTRGVRPKMSEQEREQARQEIKQAIINAAQGAEPGSLPKGVEILLKDITSPTMPWRELIQTTTSSMVKVDYSWLRPSRRSWHMDAIMPGMIPGEEVEVDIALDMSGSCCSAANKFLSEVAGIMEAFDGYKINVFCFDTEVYNSQTFTSENLEDIAEYKPQGGGGTDFTCIYDYLKKEGRVPKRLIVFTDGYPYGSWGDETYTDTTFIIYGTKTVTPPFGTWAYIDGEF
jgi:predicted metal-dependent peptidase